MQVVILCGGRGTRLGRESEIRPKPMVRIGERPILWHIMKYYAAFDHRQFVLCLGYLGDVIKDYFLNYDVRQNDVTVELGRNSRRTIHSAHAEQDWSVTLADTGLDAYTGARLKAVERYISSPTFMLTYGDGVSDIDLGRLVDFHLSHGKVGTISAVHPPARFGELSFAEGRVRHFSEKPQTSAGLINGGFFVFQREVFDYLSDDPKCSLERDLLEKLTRAGELMAYEHEGFWQCMDTVRELELLNELWSSGRAPWNRWADRSEENESS
ncbi:MAG: glucose-1-phosphate cytidylyltransferase [Acidobacteriota bacterium]|nr:MAG: glucose-1-phosphate cytidylyltransferase [Acidobacteriota bacterium]